MLVQSARLPTLPARLQRSDHTGVVRQFSCAHAPDRVFVPLRRRVVRRTRADLTYRPPGPQPDVSGNGDSVSGLLTHNSPFCPQNGVLLTERIYTISVERYRCGAECEGERNDKFEDSVDFRSCDLQLFNHRVILPPCTSPFKATAHCYCCHEVTIHTDGKPSKQNTILFLKWRQTLTRCNN